MTGDQDQQRAIDNVLTYIPARRPDDDTARDRAATLSVAPMAPSEAMWQVLAAHASTLIELGVIDEAGFAAIARGIDAAHDWAAASGSEPRTLMTDLTERIDATVPAEFAGAIALGLAREEWLAASGRLVWRQTLLEIFGSALQLDEALLTLAETHAITIMPAFVGGRATQPTTFGHLLGGLIAPLRSATRRLRAAFGAVNQSPLGAGMLAGEILAPDRERQAVMLGFDAPIGNTLDAVMSVEDLAEAAEAIAATLSPIRRFLGELIAWVRTDPSSFVLTPEWQTRPEPANPLLNVPEQIELLIGGLREQEDRCRSFAGRLREAAFGPTGALAAGIMATGRGLATDVPAVLARSSALLTEGLLLNRAFFGNRAGRAYTTGSDLAAFLMTEESLPPTAARNIAAMVLGQLEERGLEVTGIGQDMIDTAAMLVIGREIKVEMETLGRYLAPRRFLERRQVLGSPAPAMTREWLASEREQHERDVAWLTDCRVRIETAVASLNATISEAAAE